MGEVIESGIGTINYGKQPAKGTIATAATTTVGYDQPKLKEGFLKPNKSSGTEEEVDGQRFSSAAPFADKVGGEVGTPKVKVQPENAGLYPAQILGVDTVTGSSDPWTHTITSAGTSGAWGTWWQKVGANVGPVRHLYSDSKISKLVIDASDKEKIVHFDLTVMCLNPAQVYETDPAKQQASTDPYFWTETSGKVTFDGKTIAESAQEIVEIDTGIEPWQGNDVRYAQLIEKKGQITSSLKSIITNETLELVNKSLFGEANPAVGKTPVKGVYFAAAETVYEKSATRKMTIKRPRIEVKPDEMEIAPQSEGGPIDITLGGKCLKEGATPALTLVVLSGEEHSYA